ncbi:GlnS [Desulforapulum autotrophicum HRM2]|uniref:Glutamine--tRNA ligase n=1 Tax=Desulforapulum autotrophicum (strain ATCC 43914 / DSM 3382 / VKM B-1955 / HRM2) TaxID=177437 RepID=C0QET4_DESAH|nr:glutamine--tRNA ligase/YqeY domain fusion protein [Desulforapulum autotrophicum]ACN15426.1 GlnS [Desulforapulum autotrophicum HRM2]
MEDQNITSHFIKSIIDGDMKTGKFDGRVGTRFPPEPNGFLHLGHAKSICLNFGMARQFNGTCNLRFDDTNPAKEEQKYVDAIIKDVGWLGFDWGDTVYYASDYFEQLYDFAVDLIKAGNAFVCELTFEQMREYRGTLTEPGKESPYRNRSVAENLDLFERMKAGEFDEGTHALRAKIDMTSPNINLRDPVIYRIKKMPHPRTGDAWCIYPMYDFTHCISDALENITHSLCTLEFQDHRPLYDWILDRLDVPCHPQQIEFARMNLNYTIMSKRKLQTLVNNHLVEDWDDPRLPTLAGIRRRGYTPRAIRNFCATIGVSKKESRIDMGLLENVLREDLNETANRVMGVINPLRVVIENWPEDTVEALDAVNHPQKPEMGQRQVIFSREIYIEQEDFMEDPPKKFFRLGPGREVRLRYAYFITCKEVVKDDAGQISHLICTYDPATRGGDAPDGRKVKGTLHWVSEQGSIPARVRLYDRLFSTEDPEADGEDFINDLNPDSLVCLENARVEKSLAQATAENVVQFERLGYFCLDAKDSTPNLPVFNRTVTLRDNWAKKR